ncbi:MAG TPA: hypothetical protein VHG28_13205 [Longimicrobiaceae bacterium]|nr:hypothetical protein [Longimicrobiaceae bacterium]
MGTEPRLEERDTIALCYLRYLAVRDGGYRRRGRLGWALREDVEKATGKRLPERLSRLHGMGLLDREDVRPQRLRHPVWIYRISQMGADLVANREQRQPCTIPPASSENRSDTAIYIPAGSWKALQELRRAMEMRVESPYLPGEPSWRTIGDLRRQVTGEGDGIAMKGWGHAPWRDNEDEDHEVDPQLERGWPDGSADGVHGSGWDPLSGSTPSVPPRRTPRLEDVRWLVRAGLAQRWKVEEHGMRPVALYRITNLGGVAIPLEWQAPR